MGEVHTVCSVAEFVRELARMPRMSTAAAERAAMEWRAARLRARRRLGCPEPYPEASVDQVVPWVIEWSAREVARGT